MTNQFKDNFIKNGMGVVKSSPRDDRDYKIKDLIKTAPNLPKEYHNPVKTPILNQGETSECAAASMSIYRYIQEYNQNGNIKKFSPSFIYANRENGQDYEGMILRDVLKKLKSDGVCYWDEFPNFYTYPQAKEIFNRNKNDLMPKAYPNRISSYYRLDTIEDIKMAIITTGAAYGALNCYSSIFNPKNGYVIYNNKEKKNYGGHAILISGWIDGWWIVQNSWGEDYGLNGYMYIPMDNKIIGITEAWAVVDNITEDKLKCSSKKDHKILNKIIKFFKDRL
jgi:hypothetical protein